LSGGLELLSPAGPGFAELPQFSVESSYYTWVDQHDTLGLGPNVPIATGNLFDGVHALVDGKFVTLRIPYPLGFYERVWRAASMTPAPVGRAGVSGSPAAIALPGTRRAARAPSPDRPFPGAAGPAGGLTPTLNL
jgi:hypothetical protein